MKRKCSVVNVVVKQREEELCIVAGYLLNFFTCAEGEKDLVLFLV